MLCPPSFANYTTTQSWRLHRFELGRMNAACLTENQRPRAPAAVVSEMLICLTLDHFCHCELPWKITPLPPQVLAATPMVHHPFPLKIAMPRFRNHCPLFAPGTSMFASIFALTATPKSFIIRRTTFCGTFMDRAFLPAVG